MHHRAAPIPWWLPNLIAVARIGFVPLFIWIATSCQSLAIAAGPHDAWRWGAAAVLVTIGASDILDGWLARRFDLATQTGAFLDAFADKLAQLGILGFFTWTEGPAFADVPLWFFGVIVGRDAALAAGYVAVRKHRGSVHVEHRWHGKVSSVLIFAALLWLTSGLRDETVARGLVAIAGFVSASTLAYVWEGIQQLRGRRPVSPQGTPT
jgi:phosphatidylglycerophosphate synthase